MVAGDAVEYSPKDREEGGLVAGANGVKKRLDFGAGTRADADHPVALVQEPEFDAIEARGIEIEDDTPVDHAYART
jgi:hypothetical protein